MSITMNIPNNIEPKLCKAVNFLMSMLINTKIKALTAYVDETDELKFKIELNESFDSVCQSCLESALSLKTKLDDRTVIFQCVPQE